MVRAIKNNDSEASPVVKMTYTPARATRTLPFVRRVVKDLMNLRSSIDRQRVQLAGISQMSETIDQAAYRDELTDMHQSLTSDEIRFNECISELDAIGAVPHDPFDGTVDFPALLNRRPIRLCWQPGDEKVEYWHEIGEPAKDRKKIDHEMLPALAS